MVSVTGSNEIAKAMAVADHSEKDILSTKYPLAQATIEDENILNIPNCAIAKFRFHQKIDSGRVSNPRPTSVQF